jgi:hypothetical protein
METAIGVFSSRDRAEDGVKEFGIETDDQRD